MHDQIPSPSRNADSALRQRDALISIADHEFRDLRSTLSFLTKLTAETLGIGRASIWQYDSETASIRCLDQFVQGERCHSDGAQLSEVHFPTYFGALLTEKVIVADDAKTHPATRELADCYLKPLGVVSMMDSPIRVGGELFGVICCESVGHPRTWTADEQSFVVAIANSAALAVERVERREAEATLRSSEERLRAITGSALDAIVMMDEGGRTTFWNPAAKSMTGYKFDEAIGQDLVELIAPAPLRQRYKNALNTLIQRRKGTRRGKTIEVTLRRKDSTEFCAQISISMSVLNGRVQPTAIIRDITEKRSTEEKLRRAQLQYEKMLKHSPAISFHLKVIRGSWLPVAVGANISRILGYDLAETLSVDWWFRALHPDDLKRAIAIANSPKEQFINLEYRVRHKDGSYVWIADNRRILFDRNGDPEEALGVWLDITERKEAELQLAENRETMLLQTAALESTANGVVITDTVGSIKWVNKAFCDLTGYEISEVIGRNPRILNSGKQSKEVYRDLWETVIRGDVWHGDLVNRKKDGTLYHVEMTITPVLDARGEIGHFIAIKNDVTEQRRAEEELRQSEAALAKAQEIAHMGHWELDLETGLAKFSAEGLRILGLQHEKNTLISLETACRFVHENDRDRVSDHVKYALEHRRWNPLEYRVIRKDGTTGIIFAEGIFTEGEDSRAHKKLTGVLIDITLRKEKDERFKAVVESANDGILLIGNQGEITGSNRAACEMFGYGEPELLNMRFVELFNAARDLHTTYDQGYNDLFGSGSFTRECRGVNLTGIDREGRQFPLEVTISSWESGSGLTRSAIIRDISQRKALEEKLAHQALHDPLTGLPNRQLFHDRVDHALKRITRTKATIGILFIDLDNFKYVNDTLGHAAGDELLCRVAAVIEGCLRSGDTAARLGGDEFAVLVENSEGLNGAAQIAQRILTSLETPVDMEMNRLFVTASIGIAVTSADSSSPDCLLQNADVAMYTAKSKGKNRYVVFENEMLDSVMKRVQIEGDLRTAIEQQQFEIHYQPIVDLETGTIEGMEALLRWNHPRSGMLTPGEFIGVAEDSHLIVPIGKWVLEAGCKQAFALRGSLKEYAELYLTVNVASPQFQDDRFVQTVADALESSGLPASSLVLEITESCMLVNTEKTRETLERLKSIGVKLAVDDFGTGYSSLSYLRQFPIDILKIDKAFIDSLTNGPDGSAVARAIIAMGESLGLRTVAEGIETQIQQAELRTLGCKYGQGYWFSKPVRAEQMRRLLEEQLRGLWISPEIEVGLSPNTNYIC